jgi:hypothetical protein
MPDLAPMDRCPVGRKGRHVLTVVLPREDADTSLVCRICGSVRRFSSSGPLLAERLDDLSADAIAKAVRR